ncbi:MAG: hypothetical protein PHF86_09645 [Candidatus Nanoarchaeia archaeon]|jgi:hypothetical protein|nr:hypothetical protein [Candidatus Nanoarchaeia archaeon]
MKQQTKESQDKNMKTRDKNRGTTDTAHNKNWLYQKYIVENLKVMEIAELCNVPIWYIERALKNFKIKKSQKLSKIRSKETNIKRYGASSPMKNKRVQEKARKTIREKYGVDHFTQLSKIQEKKKKTNLKRYGTVCALQNKKVHKKAIKSMLERYGVEFNMQNKEIALKAARTANNSSIHYHWLTGEELVCQSSYEERVVYHLNNLRINYLWQPEVFKLSTGRTYRPDLYLVDQNLWIEIKGYFREKNRVKWEEFHTKIHPNSELWNKDKLKEKGIL